MNIYSAPAAATGFRRRRWVRAIGLALSSVALAACTVVPIGQQPGASGAGGKFDAVAYVDGIWASRVIPKVTEGAADTTTLLQAVRTNRPAAEAKYGHRAGNGPFHFLVKGEGKVLSADKGALVVDLLPADGTADLTIRIGVSTTGTAIRDAVGFIDFNDFVNQLDFADVAKQLNVRVRDEVVKGVDPATAVGKTAAFSGAFGLTDPKVILVIPVRLELRGS